MSEGLWQLIACVCGESHLPTTEGKIQGPLDPQAAVKWGYNFWSALGSVGLADARGKVSSVEGVGSFKSSSFSVAPSVCELWKSPGKGLKIDRRHPAPRWRKGQRGYVLRGCLYQPTVPVAEARPAFSLPISSPGHLRLTVPPSGALVCWRAWGWVLVCCARCLGSLCSP